LEPITEIGEVTRLIATQLRRDLGQLGGPVSD
jgi:hypothetical protein